MPREMTASTSKPPAAVPEPSRDRGPAPQGLAGRVARDLLRRYALLLVAIALFIAFAIAIPDRFATWANVETILSSQSVLLILALAIVIPLRAGDFDLSVASVMIASATIVGLLTTRSGLPAGPAILIGLAFGFGVGLINALFIVKMGMNAFVVTLAMASVLDGVSLGLARNALILEIPDGVLQIARTDILGLPSAIFIGWALAFVLWFVFECTPLGRYLLFVGGNRDAARLAGVAVDKVRVVAFVAASTIAALAGVILAGKIGAVDPTIGASYLLPPYAAAFLGTTAVAVGRFNVGGLVIAIYLLIIGITGLLLLGAAPWISNVFNGAVLLAALTFALLARRGKVE
jgi:ribose transport system permease protein